MSTAHAGTPAAAGRGARALAGGSLAVLTAAAVLFAVAWAVGGDEAVSDNWVGITVAVGLFAGLACSAVAFVTALVAGVRKEPWARLWLPLVTFPGVVLTVVLLEAFVFE